jgi:hypothetical protein
LLALVEVELIEAPVSVELMELLLERVELCVELYVDEVKVLFTDDDVESIIKISFIILTL